MLRDGDAFVGDDREWSEGVEVGDVAYGYEEWRDIDELHAVGTTLLIATHDPHLVAHAPRVYELRAGQLVCR